MEINTKLEYLKFKGDWESVRDTAMARINKGSGTNISSLWKRKMLAAERQEIRKISVNFKWNIVPYWVANYFKCELGEARWYIGATRDDQVDDYLPNSSVSLEGLCDFQECINISRKALCRSKTPQEVRKLWVTLIQEIKGYQPELAEMMVAECVYRGYCPEFKCCGFVRSSTHKNQRANCARGFRGRTDGQTTDPVTGRVYNDYILEEMNEQSRRIFDKHQGQVSQSYGEEDREDQPGGLD